MANASRPQGPAGDGHRRREDSRARPFSEHTAAQIGGLRTWSTDEYEHNGLRAD